MFIVEYSKSQNAFHVTDRETRERIEAIRKSDYEQVAEFDKAIDADLFIADNYQSIKEFGYFKNQEGELFLL